ncbi:MAG: hypothetical protein AAB815_00085 [Patescibacteria group bacterium]
MSHTVHPPAVNSMLFAGTPRLIGGGLTNEKELVEKCPPEFKVANSWSTAARFATGGASMAGWKWRKENQATRRDQFQYLDALLDSRQLRDDAKFAVAGWMLSEMFLEPPAGT